METHGRTVLITGGGAGIAFKFLGLFLGKKDDSVILSDRLFLLTNHVSFGYLIDIHKKHIDIA